MKRNFTKMLMLTAVALSVSAGMNAEGAKGWGSMGIGEYPLVINENFQNWTKHHSVASQDIIGIGGAASVSSEWMPNGNVEIPVYNNDEVTGQKFNLTLISCAVAPDFFAQYTFDDTKNDYAKNLISKGFVELGRTDYAPMAPSTGEFIIPEMEFIDGIQYSFASVGGSKRGFALYKSISGGEWELVRNETGNAGTSTSGTAMLESGYGQRFEELLYDDNVSLKFTISPNNSQIVRIHDLKVYGVVGDGRSIGNEFGDSFVIKNTREKITLSTVADIQLISTSGAVVKSVNAVEELNINDLASGVYIVKATDVASGAIKTKKILK